MSYSRCILLGTLILAVELTNLHAASAASGYLNIPSIAGDDPTPGYPGAIATTSFTITPTNLTVVKDIDGASSAIQLASLLGTNLGTISTLLYNGFPASPPDATLDFHNALVSAYSTLNATTEEVDFNVDNPLQLFLEVPGIPGESNTPGHANIMQIESFTFTAGDFQIVKLQDSASDDLFAATALGQHFPVARLLLYNSLLPQGAPDATVAFHDVQVSSYQSIANLKEDVSFSFATLSQPVPEPASLVLATAGAALLAAARGRRIGPSREVRPLDSRPAR